MRYLYVLVGLCLVFASPAKADSFLEIKEFFVYNIKAIDGIKKEYDYLSFKTWDKTQDNKGMYIKSGVGYASRLGAIDGHNAWLMLELKHEGGGEVTPQAFVRFYKDNNGIIEAGVNKDDGFIFRLKKKF